MDDYLIKMGSKTFVIRYFKVELTLNDNSLLSFNSGSEDSGILKGGL